jgi:hypothetical protein
MPTTAILQEIQLHNVSDTLTRWRSNILSSQKRSSSSREAFAIPPLCWKCWWRRKSRLFRDSMRQTRDFASLSDVGVRFRFAR